MKYKSSNKRIKSKKGINSITSLLNLFDSSKDRTNQYISNESIQKYKDTLYKGNWFVYKDDILKQLSLKSTYKELYNNFIQNYNLDSNVYTYNSFYISIYRWGIYYSEHTAEYYNIVYDILNIIYSKSFNDYLVNTKNKINNIKSDIDKINDMLQDKQNINDIAFLHNKLSHLYFKLNNLEKILENLLKFDSLKSSKDVI
jgi:hypothetical protein